MPIASTSVPATRLPRKRHGRKHAPSRGPGGMAILPLKNALAARSRSKSSELSLNLRIRALLLACRPCDNAAR